MMHFKPGRALRKISIAAVAAVFSASASFAQGITFDMVTKTSTTAPMPNGGGAMTMTTRGSATNGAMRLDFTAVDGMPGYTVGDYMLTTEGRTVLVRPASKTYVDVLDQALTMLNNLPPEMVAQMNISGITGSTEKVAGSDAVEGRPTEHYRTTLGYSMNLMGQSIPTTITSDYWIGKLPVALANPMIGGSKSAVTSGPMVELVKKQIELAPPMAGGAPLKSVMATSVSFNGQSMVTTVTTEMKNIKEGAVDAAKFVLPAGFTKAAK